MSDVSVTAIAARALVPARDFSLAQQFYQAIGFVRSWGDDALAHFFCGDAGFLLQNFYVAAHAENFQMHLLVADADAWHRRLLAEDIAGRFAVRIGAPQDQPWGVRDFVLFDPSGVLWRVAHELPPCA